MFSLGRKGYKLYSAFLPNIKVHDISDRHSRKYLIIDLDFWKHKVLRTSPDSDPIVTYAYLMDREIIIDMELYKTSKDPEDITRWMDIEWYKYFTGTRREIFKKLGF